MKKLYETKTKVDYEVEKQNVKDFIKDRFDFSTVKLIDKSQYSSPLEAIVEESFNYGILAGSYFIDKYSGDIHDVMEKRKSNLSGDDEYFYLYDDTYRHISNFSHDIFQHTIDGNVDENGDKWDYSAKVNKTLNSLSQIITDMNELVPPDYEKFKEAYSADIVFEKPKYPEFKGFENGTAGAFPFHERLSLNNILYDDIEQGRNPAYILVGDILAYALTLREHNNSIELADELKAIDLKVPFSSGILPYPESKWFTLLKQYTSKDRDFSPLTPEEKVESLKNRDAYNALPEEEKNRRQKEVVDELLSEVFAEEKADKIKPKPKHKFKVN